LDVFFYASVLNFGVTLLIGSSEWFDHAFFFVELKFREVCLLRSVFLPQLRVMWMNWWVRVTGPQSLISINVGMRELSETMMLMYPLNALFFPHIAL